MPERPPRHQSYLLRCQETRGCHTDCASNWRFSLQNSQTGEQRHFADLALLLTFLQEMFGEAESASTSSTGD
jgi:hypothetical protein